MSYELRITKARYAAELRSGVLFEIADDERIVSKGRIKPSGRMVYSGAFPTKVVARRMAAIALAYGENNVEPESQSLAAIAPTEPAPALEPEKPKAKPRKARKSKAGDE